MFKVGEFVSFHGLDEDFEWVHDVERYINDGPNFYEIKQVTDKDKIVVLNDSGRLIVVETKDYQIHTKESLKQLLTSRNHKYAAICNKVRQLYRKQEFKFQGV